MILLSLLGALQGRFGKSSAINPVNNPVFVTEKHEQLPKQWSIEIRFQSKRHKRLSGKQSDVSFTANDLLFMASRAPAIEMQAWGGTARAAHSRVTTLCPSAAFTENTEKKEIVPLLWSPCIKRTVSLTSLYFGRCTLELFDYFCLFFQPCRQSGNHGGNWASQWPRCGKQIFSLSCIIICTMMFCKQKTVGCFVLWFFFPIRQAFLMTFLEVLVTFKLNGHYYWGTYLWQRIFPWYSANSKFSKYIN